MNVARAPNNVDLVLHKYCLSEPSFIISKGYNGISMWHSSCIFHCEDIKRGGKYELGIKTDNGKYHRASATPR
jgi:hypothetical protein